MTKQEAVKLIAQKIKEINHITAEIEEISNVHDVDVKLWQPNGSLMKYKPDPNWNSSGCEWQSSDCLWEDEPPRKWMSSSDEC